MTEAVNTEATGDDSARTNTVDGQGFVAGTLVHTSEGLKLIEQIKVGDLVLSKPESGEGAVAYKPVVRTVKVEDAETWFVDWDDSQTPSDLIKKKISYEEYCRSRGNAFVLTTPNHPFWVVRSDDDYLRYGGSVLYCDPPFPAKEWVRADRLVRGVKLLLSDGRLVTVINSLPVQKTDNPGSAWVDVYEHALGLLIDFDDSGIKPSQPVYAKRMIGDRSGLVANPNQNSLVGIHHPESWFRTTVYNLVVQDSNAYFVETEGIWVHGTAQAVSSIGSGPSGWKRVE